MTKYNLHTNLANFTYNNFEDFANFKRRYEKEGYIKNRSGMDIKINTPEGQKMLAKKREYGDILRTTMIPKTVNNDDVLSIKQYHDRLKGGRRIGSNINTGLSPDTKYGRYLDINQRLDLYKKHKQELIKNEAKPVSVKPVSPKVNIPSGNKTMPYFIPDSIPKINHTPINKSNPKPKISNVNNTKNVKKLGMLGKVGIGAGIAGLGVGGVYLGNKLINRKKKNRFGL